MQTERWRLVRELFERVVDLAPDERVAVLDEICGDDVELRREVESLVGESDGAETGIPRVIAAAAREMIDNDECQTVTVPEKLGSYRVLGLLGRGGMGSVYLAEREDRAFQHRVALKVLRSGLSDTGMEARFKSERQILADLRHPNIARLVDGGTSDNGVPYLAMEFVDGRRIDSWCDERRLTIEQRLDLFRVVCSAVQAAHRSLVVHRDLKPANILVTRDGHPKLLDFGIAKILDPDPSSIALTRAASFVGTPYYVSPEQAKSGRDADARSDQYSLGALLFQLVTGEVSVEGGTAFEVLGAIVAKESKTFEQTYPGGNPVLGAIIGRAMEYEPADRYPSVRHMGRDLLALAEPDDVAR